MRSLDTLLPEQASEDFRALALVELLNNPLDWRVRRTDRFCSSAWVDIQQTTFIDFRLRRSFAREVLRTLGDAYEAPSKKKLRRTVERLLEEEDRESANPPAWDEVDLVIPVAWTSNPLLQAEVEVNGSRATPFTRRETADVFARFFGSLLKSASVLGVLEDEPVRGMWRDIGWCLTATDVVSLQGRVELRTLSSARRVGSAGVTQAVSRWMASNYALLGFSRRAVEFVLPTYSERIGAILTAVDRGHGAWERLDDRSALALATSRRYSPSVNPLLLHFSFLKRLLWETQKDSDADLSRVTIEETLDYFLQMCEYWLAIIDQVQRAAGAQSDRVGFRIGQYALRYSLLLGDSWPLLVRASIPIEKNCRASITQVLPTSSSSAFSTSHASPGRSKALGVLDFLARRPVRDVSQMSRHAIDSSLRFFGLRPNIYLQKGTHQYPLTLRDALSYHVEVHSDSPELELVPQAAFVKLPEVNYFVPTLRRAFAGTLLRLAFPLKKVPATRVFGRVVDANSRIHSFYTTKTDRELQVDPNEDELGIAPYLVVRYSVAGYVRRVNAWVSYAALALVAIYARAAFLEAGQQPHGLIDTVELSRLTATTLLSVLLLFAFERRNNLLLAAYIRRYSHVVLTAFAIFVAALAYRTVLIDYGALPHLLPTVLVEQLTAWATSAAQWFTQNEARVYLSIFIFAVALPLLLIIESAVIWLLVIAWGMIRVAFRRLRQSDRGDSDARAANRELARDSQ